MRAVLLLPLCAVLFTGCANPATFKARQAFGLSCKTALEAQYPAWTVDSVHLSGEITTSGNRRSAPAKASVPLSDDKKITCIEENGQMRVERR